MRSSRGIRSRRPQKCQTVSPSSTKPRKSQTPKNYNQRVCIKQDYVIVHKLDEFKDLPWSKLDSDRCSYDWTFGMGGHGFNNWTATISIPDADGEHCHVWELPLQIAAMLRIAKAAAAEEVRHEIRRALGV